MIHLMVGIHIILFGIELIIWKFLKEKIIRAEKVLDNQQMIIRQLTKQVCKGQQGMTKKELNRFINKVATAAVYKLYNPTYEVDMKTKTVKETYHL